MIIGFDIGINNLAYCVCDEQGGILQWEVINLKKDTEKKLDFNETANRLIFELRQRFDNTVFDTVLIENQPVMKNPVMKSIQMMIYTFFLMKNAKLVKLVAASNKLKVKEKPDVSEIISNIKTKYKQNKLVAIEYAKHYLQKPGSESWQTLFLAHKKKDDLADSFLMIVHYIETRPI